MIRRALAAPVLLAVALLAVSVPAVAAAPSAATQTGKVQPECVVQSLKQRPLEYDSTEIDAEGRVLFRLCAPAASSVLLTSGDIAQVPTGYDGKPAGLAMRKDAQGYWAVRTLTPVRAGTMRYTFTVDGVAMPDPQGTAFSEIYRGVWSVLEVPGAAAAFQAWHAEVPHGLVSTIAYRSRAMGVMRRMQVYTPPGYESGGNARYPVLYLVHGAGDSDEGWVQTGHANLILDNLIAAGKARPMIVVMPFGHTPERPGVERYHNTDFGTDLTDEIVPLIDARFRTRKGPANRAIAGLSMGGMHTLYFGLARPDLFGPIGVFSIGLYNGAPDVAAYVAANDAVLRQRAKARTLVYLAVGKDDILNARVPPTRKMLEDYHLALTYRETLGGHDWFNWRDYFADFAPRLFR